MRKPEILSPAGDAERLRAALLFGADAVYLAGERFGMRSAPRNFDRSGLREAVRAAHEQGRKVYVACNVLPRESDLPALPDYLAFLQESGADAVIAADLGVMALCRRYAPKVALHVSTQLGVVNSETARRLHEWGASRVVLARELSIEEIAQIRLHTPASLEIECFVHGAMCMSISGRCVLSNYLTGRDANGGDCAQPCRWAYELCEPTRPGWRYGVEQDEGGTYLFNANDLCMIDHVAALAQAGVSSFKIEGRAKAAYYVAVTTNAYRLAVDGYVASGGDPKYRPEPWLREELDKVSHRPYGTGFYFDSPAQNTKAGGYLRPYRVAAVVEGYADGWLRLTQRTPLRVGDSGSVLEPLSRPFDYTVSALYDGARRPIETAPHPLMEIFLPFDRPLRPGTLFRVRQTD